MMPWRTWLHKRPPARSHGEAARAGLRLELLEDRTMLSTVWYVNASATGAANGASWANAFTNLQSALGEAQAGDQVWVAQGTYKPTAGTDRTATFTLKDEVAVYGGFAGTETQSNLRDLMHHTTVLSGDFGVSGNNSDNSYHVVTAANISGTAILDGFTISDGNADGTGTNQDQGGGLFADQASPTLNSLIFTNDSAVLGGGMENTGGSPTMTNTIFSGDTATYVPPAGGVLGGGGFANQGGAPTLTNVTFNGNSGAALTNFTGSVTITNAILWGDTGGEISGGATVTYSDVQGGAAGTGNINADPQFADAAAGNLRLQFSPVYSPAIDAGTNNGTPPFDLDGQIRPNFIISTDRLNLNTDMGAYQTAEVIDLWPSDPNDPDPTNAAILHFVVIFSQPVTGFGPAGVELGGTAGATTVQVSGGSGDAFDLTVSGMTQDGTVSVDIPADVAQNSDGTGNTAWSGPQVVYDISPMTTATLSGAVRGTTDYWYASPVQVTLAATAVISGVASTSYTIDGGAARNYTGPFMVSGDGAHAITYYSVDHAGTTEVTEYTNFGIDTAAPVTNASLAGTTGNAGWYTGPVQVTLSATDATSGVWSTSYTIDGGPAQTYRREFSVGSDSFTVGGYGAHTVTFFSVDNAGNIEATKTISFTIDTSPPITTASVSGTLGNAGDYTGPVQVTLSATDATSGVASTSYAIDGGAAQTYSRPFTVTGVGTHTVTFFSVDNAGNTEATKNVSITVQPNVAGLPNGWSDQDIDGSYPAGSASYGGTWTVVGGGNGIGGTADRFNFASESVTGNTTMTAELTSFNGRNYSAFAGLMLRDSTAAGDLFVDMGYTPQWGAWMQWRTSVNGNAGNTNVLKVPAPSSTHPLWLKLVRNGNTVSGYESANGVSWTTVGSTTVALNTSALAGLAVTSEYNAPVVTATFSNVTAGLPSGLSDQDINGSYPAGSASYGGTWTVAGGGNGIGGTADKFNFASESVTGNTTITAELTSFNGTNYSAFAGLMLRNSATAGDLFVDMGYTPQWGAWMQWRTSVNGSASNTNVLKVPAPSSTHPLWLKLVQNGTAVTGYESADGVSWTMVGSTTVALTANALAGMAVTSEYNAPLVTATFTNLSVARSH